MRRVVCCVMYVACCIGVQCTSLGPPFPAQVKARDDDLPLAQVAIAFEGLPWKHPDSFALMVMQSIVPSPSFPARHCALGRSFASPLPHRRVSPPVSAQLGRHSCRRTSNSCRAAPEPSPEPRPSCAALDYWNGLQLGSWNRQSISGSNVASTMCSQIADAGLAHSVMAFNTTCAAGLRPPARICCKVSV